MVLQEFCKVFILFSTLSRLAEAYPWAALFHFFTKQRINIILSMRKSSEGLPQC